MLDNCVQTRFEVSHRLLARRREKSAPAGTLRNYDPAVLLLDSLTAQLQLDLELWLRVELGVMAENIHGLVCDMSQAIVSLEEHWARSVVLEIELGCLIWSQTFRHEKKCLHVAFNWWRQGVDKLGEVWLLNWLPVHF